MSITRVCAAVPIDVTMDTVSSVGQLAVGDRVDLVCSVKFWYSSKVNSTLPINVSIVETEADSVLYRNLSVIYTRNLSISVAATVSSLGRVWYSCKVSFGDTMASSNTSVLLVACEFTLTLFSPRFSVSR